MSEIANWARCVLDAEGLGDWIIEPGEAYCWLEKKLINFYLDGRDGYDHQLFLHEVAHALHPEPEPIGDRGGLHYHGSQFASTFGKLVTKYMVVRP